VEHAILPARFNINLRKGGAPWGGLVAIPQNNIRRMIKLSKIRWLDKIANMTK
jgi:hypothetical protein